MGRRIVIHSLDDARAALAAALATGRPVTLISAPGAAAALGAMVFAEIVAAAAREFPAVAMDAILDCGDDPGLALNALRHGIKAVRVAAPPETTGRIAAIARRYGARLDASDEPAIELVDAPDPEARCRAWLATDR